MKIISLFFILINFTGFSQEWNVRTIGTCPKDKAYSICVANGRNDGLNRIYVSTRGESLDGSIYEYTFNGQQWALSSTVTGTLKNLVTISVGKGRNDSINRIYAVEWGSTTSRVFEYTWNGSAWIASLIATTGKGMLSCIISDAHGDGINRLYVGGWIIHREYTWNGVSWDAIDISTTHGSEGPVAIGKGKNDGVFRYYAPGKRVKEFSWNGITYDESDSISNASGWPETVVIEQTRNDGIYRLLTQDNSGIWEYTWDNTVWSGQKIDGRRGRSFLFSGKTKSDGKSYTYSTDIDSAFREFSYDSEISGYTSQNIDAATGATALLDIGVGRNDDTFRIYTPNYATGAVYEITNISPYVINTTFLKENQENIFFIRTSDKGQITVASDKSERIKINIISLDGKCVYQNILFLNRQYTFNSNLKCGVYIVTVESKQEQTTTKIVIY